MTYEISLSPSGRLSLCATAIERQAGAMPDAWEKRAADSFSSNSASGLFALAASRPDKIVTPSIAYWREFSSLYLTELCRTPECTTNGNGLSAVEPPMLSELEIITSNVPPIRGAEYLTVETLIVLWKEIDECGYVANWQQARRQANSRERLRRLVRNRDHA